MKLFFQFLTQNQTVKVVQCLQLMELIIKGKILKGKIKISSGGANSVSNFSTIKGLSVKLANRHFNCLEVIPEFLGLHLGGVDARITSINGVFTPSPTCAVWMHTSAWRSEADRSSRNKYMTAKNREDVLKFHRVSAGPSIFEIVVGIATKLPRKIVLDKLGAWFAKLDFRELHSLKFFGCCDAVGSGFEVELDANVLMTEGIRVMENARIAAYPDLGKRFEDLHPLMFGSKQLCKGISDALGVEASLYEASLAKDLAIVRLAHGIDRKTAISRSAKWLIGSV